MGIGVSIFLLAVGAILAFAVNIPGNGIDLGATGVILMILGLFGLIASLVLWNDWTFGRRPTPFYDDDPGVIVRRRERVIDLDEEPVVETRRRVDARPVRERVVTRRRSDYDIGWPGSPSPPAAASSSERTSTPAARRAAAVTPCPGTSRRENVPS